MEKKAKKIPRQVGRGVMEIDAIIIKEKTISGKSRLHLSTTRHERKGELKWLEDTARVQTTHSKKLLIFPRLIPLHSGRKPFSRIGWARELQ